MGIPRSSARGVRYLIPIATAVMAIFLVMPIVHQFIEWYPKIGHGPNPAAMAAIELHSLGIRPGDRVGRISATSATLISKESPAYGSSAKWIMLILTNSGRYRRRTSEIFFLRWPY